MGSSSFYQRFDPHDEQSKTTIAEPLNVEECRIELWDYRKPRQHSLYLVSEHPGTRLTIGCRKLQDGLWKNTKVEGSSVEVGSVSRTKLKAIRISVLGERGAREAARKQRSEILWTLVTGTATVLF